MFELQHVRMVLIC